MQSSSTLKKAQIESGLTRAAELLTENLRSSKIFHGPEAFKEGTLAMLQAALEGYDATAELTYHANAFPDIKINGFGVEAKFTKRDTWSSVANSIFEGMRDPSVDDVYVMFGKGGGMPEVRWSEYEDCVKHVRTSNSPRFVVDVASDEVPLFVQFGIPYNDFALLSDNEKMEFVRDYWRGRLKPGDHLWWLEPAHTLPINVRICAHLSHSEKSMLRAEAALLCPNVVKSGGVRGKYYDAAVFALTHWGVLCPQARDLFSAGSVAQHVTPLYSGEPYISRSLRDIEQIMVERSQALDDALFTEYWEESCKPHERTVRWLELADNFATDWKPSEVLLQTRFAII